MTHEPRAQSGPRFTVTERAPTGRARLGRLDTPHGAADTPAFIFCATKGAMKAASMDQVRATGAAIVLSNTYHLLLQPGPELVESLGGLNRFMDWDGPSLTDSGGFQIFSLGLGAGASEIKGSRGLRGENRVRLSEEGAEFRSHIDGSRHMLTPERCIEVQRRIGADLIVMLDECTPYSKDKDYTAASLGMTHRWGDRCLEAFARGKGMGSAGAQGLYGVQQGGVHADLRHEASDWLKERPFFGHAVGGALGSEKAHLFQVIQDAMANLDTPKPVHLLGIGGIADIFEGVENGIDSFDCVTPTRLARHGAALVKASALDGGLRGNGEPRVNLRNARFRDDQEPLDPECPCPACQRFPRAYLHHLLRADEILAMTLLTLHNMTHMNRLMAAIRAAIPRGTLRDVRADWAGV